MTRLVKIGLATAVLGTALSAGAARADQVFNDDVIITFSLCVGNDCVNGETFGFDTIKLKENNTRIKFDDTSVSASFPNNDWQLTANDSTNGGANKFSIDDITNSRTPFTIEASAPANSLYVDDGGRVGFGTSTPVVELHVVNGDSPTLRLEQDGSSGFQAQTWDVAGNETNFFVRDVTNGSRLPFKIRPTAPTNSLYVNTNGNIGLGTASPSSALHVLRTDNANTTFTLQNTNAAIASSWEFVLRSADGFLAINDPSIAGADFILSPGATGGLTLQGELITGGGGSCSAPNPPCDRVFDANADIPSIESHAEEMWAKGYLPAVGPTRPGEPISVTVKLTRMLNELEKAHIYIAELNERIRELEGDEKTAQ